MLLGENPASLAQRPFRARPPVHAPIGQLRCIPESLHVCAPAPHLCTSSPAERAACLLLLLAGRSPPPLRTWPPPARAPRAAGSPRCSGWRPCTPLPLPWAHPRAIPSLLAQASGPVKVVAAASRRQPPAAAAAPGSPATPCADSGPPGLGAHTPIDERRAGCQQLWLRLDALPRDRELGARFPLRPPLCTPCIGAVVRCDGAGVGGRHHGLVSLPHLRGWGGPAAVLCRNRPASSPATVCVRLSALLALVLVPPLEPRALCPAPPLFRPLGSSPPLAPSPPPALGAPPTFVARLASH